MNAPRIQLLRSLQAEAAERGLPTCVVLKGTTSPLTGTGDLLNGSGSYQ